MTVKELEAKVKILEVKLKSMEGLEAKVRTLEDIEEIKKLQRAYGYYLEHMMVEDIVDLFADGNDVELWLTAGKFKGKEGVQRLYNYIRDSFPGPEFLHQLMQLSGIVDVNPERCYGSWKMVRPGGQRITVKGRENQPRLDERHL